MYLSGFCSSFLMKPVNKCIGRNVSGQGCGGGAGRTPQPSAGTPRELEHPVPRGAPPVGRGDLSPASAVRDLDVAPR